jgi:hypothetical protein
MTIRLWQRLAAMFTCNEAHKIATAEGLNLVRGRVLLWSV